MFVGERLEFPVSFGSNLNNRLTSNENLDLLHVFFNKHNGCSNNLVVAQGYFFRVLKQDRKNIQGGCNLQIPQFILAKLVKNTLNFRRFNACNEM